MDESAADLEPNASPREPDGRPILHVVLHRPEIAANVGAIGRTCVAVGAALWLIRPLGFHLDDRKLKRAGMDYWPQLNLHVRDDLEAAIADRAAAGAQTWYFSTKGKRPHTLAEYRPGDALVFGAEGHGLPDVVLSRDPDRVVRIPMLPRARSLNLANAAAVGIYEALRQATSESKYDQLL